MRTRQMQQTPAHLDDRIIPNAPVRQWVFSLLIALQLLLASQPRLLTSLLQVVQRSITQQLLDGAGLKDQGHGGAVTLIQRIGSAANLNVSFQDGIRQNMKH